MPASFPLARPYPGKPYRTYGDAARDNMILTMRCNLCRVKRYYLARDLVQVVDPQTPITQIPFTCSRCGDNDCIDIRFQSNVAILNKSFYLRRLVGIRKMPLWEDQLYDQWDGR